MKNILLHSLFYKYLHKILKNKENFIYLTTLSFWLTLIVVNPSNTLITILLLLWSALFFIKLKDLRMAIILTFLLSLPFVGGKIFFIEVIPSRYLSQELYPVGYSETIVIKPANILIGLMFLILIRDLFSKPFTLPFKKEILLLMTAFLWMGISSITYSFNPEISSAIYLQLLQIPIFFLYLVRYCLLKKDVDKIFLALISATTTAISLLVLAQFIQGSRLGLSIEIHPEEIIGESNFEELFIQFRPFGTFYHANALAAFVLPMLPLFLIRSFFTKRLVTHLTFFLAIIIILLSMGRSAWFSATVAILICIYWAEKIIKLNIIRLIIQDFKRFFIPLVIIVAVSWNIFIPRIIRTFNTLQESGGGDLRLQQIKEALEAISQYALFGVGLGMNVSYFFQNVPKSVIFGFPNQIHNGYLLLATETGVISTILILSFISMTLHKIIKGAKKLVTSYPYQASAAIACTSGIIAALINALFQPYLIQHREPHFEIIVLMIFMGVYYTLNKKSRLIKNNDGKKL